VDLKKLEVFQNYPSFYKIIAYFNLSPESVIFEGNFLPNMKLYPLYYCGTINIITKLKASMAKSYTCNACDPFHDKTHKFDRFRSVFTATRHSFENQSNYCATCNTLFLSEKYYRNNSTLKVKGKLVCQWRQVYRNYNFTVTIDSKHEICKRFF